MTTSSEQTLRNQDLMLRHPDSKNAQGGTEQMQSRLYNSLPRELLEKFQIWFSRYDNTKVDPSKIQILYVHDLPGDPMYDETLSVEGRKKFSIILFVSNWQMQVFMSRYGLRWSECAVVENAIELFDRNAITKVDDGKIRLIYHTTPHRGLHILASVYDGLAKKYPLHLDVFSSFNVYGWPQRDEQYKPVFDYLKSHPKVTYHGAQPNAEVREYLTKADIFAYPSIWPETSCIALMEAMAAGCHCVHSNYAALPETSGSLTHMYHMQEDWLAHAEVFGLTLEAAIQTLIINQKKITPISQPWAEARFNWVNRAKDWEKSLSVLAQIHSR